MSTETTTPTPVERAARAHGIARDARFDGLGDTWGDLTPEDRTAECEDMREALVAALDVDEIARVLAPDDWRMAEDPRYAHLPDGARESLLRKSREQAAAVVAHLTGATR